jgi:hypothetical protein
MSLALAFIIGVTAVVASGLAASKKTQPTASGIVVGNEKDLRVTEYAFNDAGNSSLDVWSASKIESFLNKNSPAYVSSTAKSGNVVFFGVGSELVDRGITIDDSKNPSPNVLWTSAKTSEVISASSAGFMTKVPTAIEGDFCTFDDSGQVVDSGLKLNDSGTSSKDVWSASKILSVVVPEKQMQLVPLAQQKTLAVFDSKGQVVSSGMVMDDSLAPAASVVWTSQKIDASIDEAAKTKMTLVPQARANDWVAFDGTGQVIDAGVTLNDSGTTNADVWSSAKIQAAINDAVQQTKTSASSLVAAQSDQCKAAIDAATGVNANNLSALNDLSKTLNTKMNLVPTAKVTDVAIFDNAGQVVDSNVKFNDSGTTASDVWSASKISSAIATVQASINSQLASQSSQQTSTNTQIQTQITSLQQQEANLDALLKKKMDLVPTAINNHVGIFNGSGQVVDSGFVLDDASTSATVLWSSEKVKSLIDASTSSCTTSFNNVSSQIASTSTATNGKMALQPAAKQNSVALFNGSGQAVGSSYFINDSGTTVSDLWTASKTTAAIDTRVSYSGVPVVNDLALWTTTTSIGDAKVSINDGLTTTSNLWTAAKTKAYWDAQMLATYSNKCWFKGTVNEQVTVGASKQNFGFTITDTSPCATTGSKTSVSLPRAGAYQINLWLLFYNAASANGKMLVFTPSATQSLKMPIYVVNGNASVNYQTVCSFAAGSSFSIPLQLVNADGTTPATGSSLTIQNTYGQGNLIAVQEM